MAQTAIHEGLHLLFAGASDERLGVAFSGRPITGNEDQRRDEGSRRISAAIQQHCQNEGQ
jgi:hypothetical protein